MQVPTTDTRAPATSHAPANPPAQPPAQAVESSGPAVQPPPETQAAE